MSKNHPIVEFIGPHTSPQSYLAACSAFDVLSKGMSTAEADLLLTMMRWAVTQYQIAQTDKMIQDIKGG